jgi:hypothetical protein
MRTSVIVVDNFYRQPDTVRRIALDADYYPPYQSSEDIEAGTPASWLSSRFLEAEKCPFKSSERLIRTLERITGATIDREHWRRSFPLDAEGRPAPNCEEYADRGCLWNCTFHIKPKTGQQLGEGIHNHVTDIWNSVGVNGWAGLVYLNREAPRTAGLSLWDNYDPRHQFDWMTEAENWELRDQFSNIYNRLLLMRGDIPHSGADGWVDSLERGRLYQTFFFRVVPDERAGSTPGVDIGG